MRSQGSHYPKVMIAVLIIIATTILCLTYYLVQHSRYVEYHEGELRFGTMMHDSQLALMHRMESYDHALLGGAGFFAGSDFVSRIEWQRYVKQLDAAKNLPGMNGMGFIKPILRQDVNKYLEKIHKSGTPNFTIHPKTTRDELYVVQYIEPVKHNAKALGLDIAFEEKRYLAASLARDIGKPVITKKINLVQDEVKRPGFLLLHPFYQSGVPLDTVQDRRKAFRGWIYSPFIAANFFQGLTPSQRRYFDITIYDGDKISKDNLIYTSKKANNKHQSLYTIKNKIRMMERSWVIEWESTTLFDANIYSAEAYYILLAGLGAAVIWCLLIISELRRNRIIEESVLQKTKQIRANEQQMQTLIRYTPSAVVMFDKNMCYMHASHAWLKEHDLRGKDIEGESYYNLFPHMKDNPLWLDYQQQALRGGIFKIDEDQWLNENGYMQWMRWALHPWHDVNGEIGGLILFTENITERKQHEIRLKITREMALDANKVRSTHKIIENMLVRVCGNLRYDLGHALCKFGNHNEFEHIWHENSAGNENFIRNSERLIDVNDEYFCGESTPSRGVYFSTNIAEEEQYSRKQTALSTGFQSSITLLINTLIGKYVILEFYSKNRLDIKKSDIEFFEILGFNLSRILGRREVEQSLEESNALNMAVLNSSEFMIVATDLNGRIMIFNKSAEKQLGYDADEVVGKQTPLMWHDKDELAQHLKFVNETNNLNLDNPFLAMVHESVADDKESNHSWTFIRKDKSTFPASLSVTKLCNNLGEIVGYLGIACDVTEQCEIERIKNEFISTVSHELRTPLTSIRGSLGLILGKNSDTLTEKVHKLLKIADYNCEQLIMLINDILDIEKIASGEMPFQIVSNDLCKIIAQSINANHAYAKNYDVKFNFNYPETQHVVMTDNNRLTQVITNVLSNAAKYSPKDDVVNVELVESDHDYKIAITDKGPGIAEDMADKIFGKFVQQDSSLTRKKGGTGLGLYICKNIMEKLQGDIYFTSQPNIKTTFYIVVPKEYS